MVAYLCMMLKTFATGSEWTYLCCVVLMRSSWIFWSKMSPLAPNRYVMRLTMVHSRTLYPHLSWERLQDFIGLLGFSWWLCAQHGWPDGSPWWLGCGSWYFLQFVWMYLCCYIRVQLAERDEGKGCQAQYMHKWWHRWLVQGVRGWILQGWWEWK